MASVSGELQAGEAQGATQAIAARQRGSTYLYYGVMFGLLIGGAAIGAIGGGGIDVATGSRLGGDWGVPLGLFAGWLAYILIARRLLVRRFRRQMQTRGLSTRLDYGLSFDDAGMTVRSGGVTKTAVWPAVTEVFKARDYWVFLVQMDPWFAPTRFFADADEERAFLREALGRMTPEARDRSADAVRYVMF